MGDKGYALNKTDKESLFNDHNIELVYPHKKLQKNIKNYYKIDIRLKMSFPN